MGVLVNEGHRTALNRARKALMQNLAEAADLEIQLENLIRDIYRRIELVNSLNDPENY